MQGGRLAAQREDGARQVQHRAVVGALRLDAARAGLGRPRQPRLGGPAVAGVGRPRDRRATAVAPAGIDDALGRHLRVLEAELLARVEEGRAAQGEQQQHGGARAGLRAAQARAHARLVVVGEHPRRPAGAHDALDMGDARAPGAGLPRHGERLEVEGEVQLVAVAEIGGDQLRPGEVDLADHHAVAGILVEHRADPAQQRVRPRVVVGAHHVEVAADDVGLGDVGQRGVLADEVHDVRAEAVDAAVQPEAQHVVHRADHLRVVPVEVGLLGQEGVQVPLPGGRVPRPRGAAAERGGPVVGRDAPASRRASGTSRAWRESRDARLSTNHGCWSEVWLGTQSRSTRRSRACASASSASKAARSPKSGSTSQ